MRTLICLLASIALSAQTPSGGAAKAPAAKFSPAEITRRVVPEYSPEAQAANYEGTLTLYVEINPSGKPGDVQVIQGLGMGLDEKAVEAVKQWEFKPAELNGEPLQTAQSIEIRFRLDPAGGWRVRHTGYIVTHDKHDAILEKPVLTRYTRPDPSACRAGGSSLVTVNFGVDRNGVPHDIQTGSKDASAQAVLDTVQTWRFKPARSEGNLAEATAAFTLKCGPDAPPEADRTDPPGSESKVKAPKPISQPEPNYSEAARKAKWVGNVRLSLLVDRDGFTKNLRIDRMLDFLVSTRKPWKP